MLQVNTRLPLHMLDTAHNYLLKEKTAEHLQDTLNESQVISASLCKQLQQGISPRGG
jgi:hypothetical protein